MQGHGHSDRSILKRNTACRWVCLHELGQVAENGPRHGIDGIGTHILPRDEEIDDRCGLDVLGLAFVGPRRDDGGNNRRIVDWRRRPWEFPRD
jgi:hypothetical protein